MARQTSKGKCMLCDSTFSKAGMTKHLQVCKQKNFPQTTSRRRKSQPRKNFHLVVEGRYLPMYWMHLEVLANATLQHLDAFLRQAWLECCWHLSAFTIQGVTYSSSSGLIDELDHNSMDVELDKILSPSLKFYHEYDFGTTTELALKVVAEQEGQTREEAITILAQNDPPPIPCGACGKLATQVCGICVWETEGWLCDECASKHKCGEDMLLGVVNSPRVGMCGYSG